MSDEPHTDFAGRMSYGDYLRLDTLLDAQKPLTEEHDEMLFVIIHQVKELWMKLLNHELDTAMVRVAADELPPAFKCLARVSRIQEQLIQAWTVLSTMTPADYLAFRHALGAASGFQSWQYRLIEFKLGAKDRAMLAPHRHRPDLHGPLETALHAPSIYDECLRLLARRGFSVPRAVLERDVTRPHSLDEAIVGVWVEIYREAERHFDLYELAEELIDVEDAFQQWRFRHLKTVERIIGMRAGTGGTAGAAYLKRALDRSFFPEIWAARTEL